MNYVEFKQYIDLLVSDFDGEKDHNDFAHECADNSEHVIYTAKAWDLVNMIRLADHELLDHAENYGEFEDVDQYMTMTAYNIIYVEVMDKLHEMAYPRRTA